MAEKSLETTKVDSAKLLQGCAKDIFGYCKNEPKTKDSPETVGEKYGVRVTVAKCDLDPKTCGSFVSASEVNQPVEGLENTYKHKKASSKKKDKEKGKEKKSKKKVSSQQGRLFE